MSGTRVYDPSKLHLKKELTQIRKASRALRDPGTTSTWKSPLNSSRSAIPSSALNFNNQVKSNAVLRHCNGYDPNTEDNSPHLMSDTNSNQNNGRDKEKRVFLYNWRSNKLSSEKSFSRRASNNDGSSIHGSVAASVSVDGSLSDARNAGEHADSRSDSYVADHCQQHYSSARYSSVMRCGDMRLEALASPTRIRRATNGRKKSRKSSAALRKQQKEKRLEQVLIDRKSSNSKFGAKGIPSSSLVFSQDDSVDQSHDAAGDYCNSEDLREASLASPLLRKLRQKNLSQSSLKFFRGSRKDDSSFTQSTPALSVGSYSKYLNCGAPSTLGSSDGTTASFDDDELDGPVDLPVRQGCGIPCYWSRSKSRGSYGSYYSPSLSETLRTKGSKLLCGGQQGHQKHHQSSSRAAKQKNTQGLPLLTNSCDGGRSSLENSDDDELSTNFSELDLEGLSRLDGRRWSSSCRGGEGLELMTLAGKGEEDGVSDNIRSLSQRYRPMFFDELIGQNIVVQSLKNALVRGRIASVYLFQGPRGTGKTSTAMIFASALNCLASGGTKPCGICRECTDFISGKCRDIMEVNSSNKMEIDRVRYLLKSLSMTTSSATSRYKVFVIDECHLLTSRTWSAFVKFFEESHPRVVFIFVTTDLENVPRSVLSRCQKYLFNKIKDDDIVGRLIKISSEEDLDVETDALQLIALNADGSLRDAETMLDQLSLLGKRITASLVNELVGVVSDEKLLELLELAMSSNTAETVRQARELMDSGVDPLALMSQLACIIMDIITGTNQPGNPTSGDSFFDGRSLNKMELEKLKHALKFLSEAERQLRVSSERSTWFTATLLQLGSITSPDCTLSCSSRRQSSKTTEEDPSTASRDAHDFMQKFAVPRRSTSSALMLKEGIQNGSYIEDPLLHGDCTGSHSKATCNHSTSSVDDTSSQDDLANKGMALKRSSIEALDDLWLQCIARCHSKTLRQLLNNHGKLVSISENDGGLVAYIAFGDEDIKSRAERFIISITNSMETVLRRGIEVRIIFLPAAVASLDGIGDSTTMGSNHTKPARAINNQEKVSSLNVDGPMASDSHQEPFKVGRGNSSDKLNGGSNHSPLLDRRFSVDSAQGNANGRRRQEVPMQRIESIIREQRLESAWLQAVEKGGTPRSVSRLRPEKNQVLPQDGGLIQAESMSSIDISSSHQRSEEFEHEVKVLNERNGLQKDRSRSRVEHHPISPSLLHQSSMAANLSKECQGYESGPGSSGCNMLFCWNTKPHKKAKVKNASSVRSHRNRRFSCLGKSRRPKLQKQQHL